jgi:hypothetical protein
MSLENFEGQTWVAYSDLCGTKAIYRENPNNAAKALNRFYNEVYNLNEPASNISSLVVSDCAIFWVDRNGSYREEGMAIELQTLEQLLSRLNSLHKKMISEDYLIKTTISYGHFRYQNRLEMPRIRKDMIIGGAYLDVYAKNDKVNAGSIVLLTEQNKEYQNLILSDDWRWKNLCHKMLCGKEYYWCANAERDIARIQEVQRIRKKQERFQKLKELYRDLTNRQ